VARPLLVARLRVVIRLDLWQQSRSLATAADILLVRTDALQVVPDVAIEQFALTSS
jgi:hypothetical protein